MFDDGMIGLAIFLLGILAGAVINDLVTEDPVYKGPDVEHHYFQVPVPYCNKPEERVS